jgi:hypothetical protein
MIVTVTIETDTGPHAYTGHIVCRGPSTMEMLLTDPFPMAGRTVQFPLSAVASEKALATREAGPDGFGG